jgi:parallel beta-helix repeat protein
MVRGPRSVKVLFRSFTVLLTLHGVLSAATINVPGDQPTIQAGIDAATNGDEVVVAPGTYLEAINFLGKSITLRSASSDPTDTIIDGTGNFHVVQCVSSEGSDKVLQGFTITGGNANGAFPDDRGGGMYNSSSGPTVTHCIFSGNMASFGGGMFNFISSPKVTHCSFSGDTAGFGGGIYNQGGSPTMINCAFSGNTAGTWGGGMYSTSSSSPTLINCTFTGNTAGFGGGIYNNNSSNSTVTNCILWGDSPDEIFNNGSTPTVSFSDLQGGLPAGTIDGGGNIDTDPLFVDAVGGNLRLQSVSPCIDAGDNTSVPGGVTTDLNGTARFVDDLLTLDTGNGAAPVVDMGAYEFRKVHNLTQATSLNSLQAAINASVNGDEIEAVPGTYHENINFVSRAITLRSASGVPNDTIINGNGAVHVVSCIGGETSTTVLQGFTITGGNANGTGFGSDSGGGMYNRFTSPTLSNCIFSGNTAKFGGGGMFNDGSSPTVTNCTFSANTATNVGGGMFNENSSSPTVSNCTFSANTFTNSGGGMFNDGSSSPTVTNCTFSGNIAIFFGGGMSNAGSSPTMTNCTFSGNEAPNAGGGMYNSQSMPTVTNCTFSGNTAFEGGGMYNTVGSDPMLTNCILWGNSGAQIHTDNGTPVVNYSNVQGGWIGAGGSGNLNADPLFVDANGADNTVGTVDDDLRLLAGSPCIDSGDSTAVPAGVITDLNGNPRFVDDPNSTNSGTAICPNGPVDMGAYEFQTIESDSDGDGVVDSCDLCLGNDATGDSDTDGVCNNLDLCPDFDDLGPDVDDDGTPDACDSCILVGDINCDGIVNELDFALMALHWLETI